MKFYWASKLTWLHDRNSKDFIDCKKIRSVRISSFDFNHIKLNQSIWLYAIVDNNKITKKTKKTSYSILRIKLFIICVHLFINKQWRNKPNKEHVQWINFKMEVS